MVVYAGLADSLHKAQALIMAGLICAGGRRVDKAGQLLDVEVNLTLKETLPFVSRGGLKLAEALEKFELTVEGKTAADIGASTGGFTDCLLQRGAVRVYAVDVDIRQLDSALRQNPGVVPVEKNARYLVKEDIPEVLDLVTIDLSFITVLKVLPAVKNILDDGVVVSLIKPQFEVRRNQVGKKGIVRDRDLHEEVLLSIAREAEEIGFSFVDAMKPAVRGQKGNQEYFFLWMKKDKGQKPAGVFSDIIKEAVWDEKY
jgi:23S rRNA (cytidine1920-2'-O)/16S rRNA (cytidine1409-2'-O)-methyltransferase